MKTKVTPTAENEVELSVEIPLETVKKVYERTISHLRGELQMPGFRKGHVPRDMVVAHFGTELIRGEALEEVDLVGRASTAIRRQRLDEVRHPPGGRAGRLGLGSRDVSRFCGWTLPRGRGT